ncbi:MAG: hypothetical protein AAGE59_32385 [Cyanobacteria bacterium P01_F01_bin.86]
MTHPKQISYRRESGPGSRAIPIYRCQLTGAWRDCEPSELDKRKMPGFTPGYGKWCLLLEQGYQVLLIAELRDGEAAA